MALSITRLVTPGTHLRRVSLAVVVLYIAMAVALLIQRYVACAHGPGLIENSMGLCLIPSNVGITGLCGQF